ncbi:MAG: hypothetical protein QXK19_02585 [Nitrososphaerota archaeon]
MIRRSIFTKTDFIVVIKESADALIPATILGPLLIMVIIMKSVTIFITTLNTLRREALILSHHMSIKYPYVNIIN